MITLISFVLLLFSVNPLTGIESGITPVKNLVLSESNDGEKRPLAVVRRFNPDVLVKSLDDTDWINAIPTQPLFDADSLVTDDSGFAMIQFMDSSILRLRPNSLLIVNGEVRGKDNTITRLSMEAGELLMSVTGTGSTTEIRTPSAVAAVRGTRFNISIGEDGSSTFTGFSGSLVVRLLNSDEEYEVGGGDQLEVESDGITATQSSIDEDGLSQILALYEDEDDDEGTGTIELRFVNDAGEIEVIILEYREN